MYICVCARKPVCEQTDDKQNYLDYFYGSTER